MASVLSVVLLGSLLPQDRLRTVPLELRDPVIYGQAGVPILPTNQRLVNFYSSPLVLSNLSPHRTAAYSPALELPRLRITNLNSLSRGLMHNRMKGAIQGTPGVDPRQLQLIPYGVQGSAGSVFEPGRRNRASNLLLGPRRRTMSYFDPNLIRPPGQIIQRRSAVLGTGGHEPYWYRRLRGPLWRRASVLPVSRGQSPDAFLEQYGYLDKNIPGQQHSEYAKRRAIREFQQMSGLLPTGGLNRETIRQMRTPRCGFPDVISPRERIPGAPIEYTDSGYKWPRNELTYKFTGYSDKLPVTDVRDAWRNALNRWERHTPLRFTEVPANSGQSADIRVQFGRRDHGDSYPFDGPGSVLAHAFFPGTSGLAGDAHFDDDENWTRLTNPGADADIIMAHEIGHSLGLGHSRNQAALMAPYFRGWTPGWSLHRDDIRGIQSIYGAGTGPPSRPPSRPPNRPRNRPPRDPREPNYDDLRALRLRMAK